MDTGGCSTTLRKAVRKFNGGRFAERTAIPLLKEEIGELYEAAKHVWTDVEPAIFGTLLEQALDKDERKRLGAHYTPRAYVERLVEATITRSEEHTSELQSLMRISYAVFCLKKKKKVNKKPLRPHTT